MIKAKKFKKVGIVGYGSYVPRYRLEVGKIAEVWERDGGDIEKSLGVARKSVADSDEDCVTMGVEAAQEALRMAGIDAGEIGAVLVGSESHPYAVKPSGTIVADILGMREDYFCVDLQFACKAATAGIQMIAAMIESGMIDYGLVVGSDKAQGKPGDALEYTAAAGAVAVILGGKSNEWVAKLEATSSFSSDTPDFWRRPGEKFPAHGGRFTGEPAYFRHVVDGTKRFLEKQRRKITDFDNVVFHMPNLKFPVKAAKVLGVGERQLTMSLIVKEMGNAYSASALLGLVAVLDQAHKGERILVTAYGSGAGSDSFSLVTREGLYKARKRKRRLRESLSDGVVVTYPRYLQMIGEL